MESLTYMKQLRVSPKSMRFMLGEIKKLSPQQSLNVLKYATNKEAKFYYKAIHSAIHNAVQTLKVSEDVLQFRLLTIEAGRPLKRYRPGARGGVRQIKKRYSHIKIVMGVKELPIKKEVVKTEPVKATKKIVSKPKSTKKAEVQKVKKNNV